MGQATKEVLATLGGRGCNFWLPPGVTEGMRNEFLRDVIAGSAGVLVVLALIGLPKEHPAPTQHKQVQWQGIRLLPYYTRGLAPTLSPPLTRYPARPTP